MKFCLNRTQGFFLILICSSILGASIGKADVRRGIGARDRYEDLTPGIPFVDHVADLDRKELLESSVAKEPWGNRGEWSMREGVIVNRYRDDGYSNRSNWKDRRDYLLRTNVRRVFDMRKGRDRDRAIDKLSPAEKYDILMGHLDDGLTQAMIKEVDRFSDAGRLFGWLGICEGIAGASVAVNEPKKDVELLAFDGQTKVKFYAQDIQGLVAMMWSEYMVKIPIVGNRCVSGDDADPFCADTNPGTWHVAMLNFVGLRKQALLGSFAPDGEVWNYPVTAYKLRYFNPQNRTFVDSPLKAMMPIEKYRDDRNKLKRSPNATHIVGVTMEYGTRRAGGSSLDHETSYDLEIDSTGKIVGGEWSSNDRPDFLWAIPPGFKPVSVGDALLPPTVAFDRNVSSDWTIASQISARMLQPLPLIINRLVELSQ